jgi:uridine kinase
MMETLQKHRDLLKFLKGIIYPWRKLTVGVDGADGVGKSPLARFLSWQLGMPTLETDMFLEKGKYYPFIRYAELSNLIDFRHSLKRPVIVEVIYLLDTLERINVKTDVLIYVKDVHSDGSVTRQKEFELYRERYDPLGQADYIYKANKEKDYR